MSEIMEKLLNRSRQEIITESQKATALRMLASGRYGMDEIVEISGLSLEEVQKLQHEKSA